MSQEQNELAALSQALKKTMERKRHLGQRRVGRGPCTASPRATTAKIDATPVPVAHLAQPQVLPASPESQTTMARECLNLDQLERAASRCQACPLHKGRHNPVFSDGNPGPGGILFLGEAPSDADNSTGTPFSGPPGQLLTDIIVKGMGLNRQQVTITPMVKCPTPGGRAPAGEEVELCAPILRRQLELVNPRVLIPLGQGPANFLLARKSPLAELRNQIFESQGRQIVATFHPGQLLQDPAKKRDCWADIRRAMAAADIKKPS
ncbi:MAG: uracil-DNA glycosylase [bacterium]|nr:uracil-DNA glycosylase [bacterium]